MQGLTPCEAVPFRSPYLHPEGIIYRIDEKTLLQGTQKATVFKSPYRAGRDHVFHFGTSAQKQHVQKMHKLATIDKSKNQQLTTSKKSSVVQKKSIEQMILDAEKEYQKELSAYTLDRKLDKGIAELEREIKKDQIELEHSEGKRKKFFGIF